MEDYNDMAMILKLKTIYAQKGNFDDYHIKGMKDFEQSSTEFQILSVCQELIKKFRLDEDKILNERNVKYVIRILEEEIKNGTTFKIENTYFSIINSGVIYTWRKEIEGYFSEEVYGKDYWIDIYIYTVLSTFFHEICHVVHGHVLYFKQALNEDILFMEEGLDATSQKGNSLARKTLEWDADQFSASKLVELWYALNNECVAERAVKQFLYAIIFKFYDGGNYCNKKSENYLSPLYRMIPYVNAFYEHAIAEKSFQMEKTKYNELIISCINEIITVEEYRKDFAGILLGEYYEEKKLREAWKEIRNDLSQMIGDDTILPV